MVTNEGNFNEIKARAKHHAKKLLPLTKMLTDIFSKAYNIRPLKTRLRIYTTTGVYVIRGYKANGGYEGIEVTKLRSKEYIRLKVLD